MNLHEPDWQEIGSDSKSITYRCSICGRFTTVNKNPPQFPSVGNH